MQVPWPGRDTRISGHQFSPSPAASPSHGAGHSSCAEKAASRGVSSGACETSTVLGGGEKQSKRSPPLEPVACSGYKMQLQDHCRHLLRIGQLARFFYSVLQHYRACILKELFSSGICPFFFCHPHQTGFSVYPHTLFKIPVALN